MNKSSALSLTELTSMAIEEQKLSLSSLDKSATQNLTNAIRENLNVWEKDLFPLLRAQKKSQYDFISSMLVKAGFKEITANHICVVINKIRRERKNHG